MIDLHCHVLPRVDDGPPGGEDSLALLAAASTRTMVATPHVSATYANNWRVPRGCGRRAP